MVGHRYRLEGMLGSGGMADVCLAWDLVGKREVAIKVIKQENMDQRALDRFSKEAEKVVLWNHPNILRVYTNVRMELLDKEQGSILPYIVMEYAEGGDLHRRLTAGQPYDLSETLPLFRQLCSAVAYAHEHGVIHRDLKPLNILFRVLPDGTEQPVLSDFGLAVEVGATHFTYARGGTLPYMAPEQLRGVVVPESDIFALGVILYQLCTGRMPFRRTLADVGRYIHDPRPPAPPTRPSRLQALLPEALDAVLFRALHHDPEHRYADALELWEAVEAAFFDPPKRHRSFRAFDERSRPASLDHETLSMRLDDDEDLALDEESFSPRDTFIYPSARPTRVLPYDTEEFDDPEGPPSGLPPRHRRSMQPDTLDLEDADPVDPPLRRSPRGRPTGGYASRRYQTRGLRSRDYQTQDEVPRARPASLQQATRIPRTAARTSGKRGRGVMLVSIVIALLVGGLLTWLLPFRGLSGFGQASQATVKLTVSGQEVSDSFIVSGVEQNPDLAHLRVTMHEYSTTESASQDATATGQTKTEGAHAQGILKFTNGAFVTQTVPAGTQLTSKSGIKVITDAEVIIPSANSDTRDLGTVLVPAHAIDLGPEGNIPALDIDTTCCSQYNSIYVKNEKPFTGGQDAASYTFVQQADVDKVAKPLAERLKGQGVQKLKGQLRAGEASVGEPQCTPKVASEQPIGDQGRTIERTKVTVSQNCRVLAYNKQEVETLVRQRLSAKATADAGKDVALSDQISTTVKPCDCKNGMIVEAKSVATPFFNPLQQQHLAKSIAGRTVDEAIKALKQQQGVRDVVIEVGGANRLPQEPAAIHFEVLVGT
jgi:serine/threonine protein kinase